MSEPCIRYHYRICRQCICLNRRIRRCLRCSPPALPPNHGAQCGRHKRTSSEPHSALLTPWTQPCLRPAPVGASLGSRPWDLQATLRTCLYPSAEALHHRAGVATDVDPILHALPFLDFRRTCRTRHAHQPMFVSRWSDPTRGVRRCVSGTLSLSEAGACVCRGEYKSAQP